MCKPNDVITGKVEELVEIKAMIEELENEAEAIIDEIKAFMGAEETMMVGTWKVTYKEIVTHRLDTKALKMILGDALNGYYRTVVSRAFKVT